MKSGPARTARRVDLAMALSGLSVPEYPKMTDSGKLPQNHNFANISARKMCRSTDLALFFGAASSGAGAL